MGWVDGVVLPLCLIPSSPSSRLLIINLRGVGLVIFLLFTIVVGWIAKGIIGHSLIGYAEQLVDRMPVVRSIYSGIKQISETVFAGERSFEKAA